MTLLFTRFVHFRAILRLHGSMLVLFFLFVSPSVAQSEDAATSMENASTSMENASTSMENASTSMENAS
ncbi:MAG: hypothetical protein JXA28_15355, partial [Bacteroidetes bacterium]|nr:hypothetical protein [Bacteroidota bacterium]